MKLATSDYVQCQHAKHASNLPILAILVVVQLVLNHADHDVVRHELALIHDLLCLSAQVGLCGNLSTQHVSGSQVTDTELVLDARRLCSLAW